MLFVSLRNDLAYTLNEFQDLVSLGNDLWGNPTHVHQIKIVVYTTSANLPLRSTSTCNLQKASSSPFSNFWLHVPPSTILPSPAGATGRLIPAMIVKYATGYGIICCPTCRPSKNNPANVLSGKKPDNMPRLGCKKELLTCTIPEAKNV
jgi:hypothetical protein